jgi:Leucine-rich repeat (LRR) protein
VDWSIVIVREGTYRETINFAGRNTIVTGFDPDEPNSIGSYPVLDADYAGTAVAFENEEGPYCLLEGFVITRGMGDIAGAISCINSNPKISNCLIVGNRATNPDGGGGAVFCQDSNAVFENCTFSGNYGGPQAAGFLIYDSNVAIMNSILWDNYTEVSVASGSLPSITYSDIQGQWPGTGNMAESPLFAEPGYWARSDTPDVQADPFDANAVWIDGDYHLLSEFGRYRQGRNRWILDEVTSPCINAGNLNSDVGEEPFPHGYIINMGAYGGTSQASMFSPIQEPVHFPDAKLKAVVEQALGVTDPTPTDMLILTSLTAYGKEITDLTGLEYALKLNYLYLTHNQIRDLSALAGLMSLKTLILHSNQISDISALTGLTNLIDLYLEDNQISDISVLANLTNLAFLGLSSNQISDISVLAGLTKLHGLKLSDIQISDMSPLTELKDLAWLYLDGNQISDISALTGLTNLYWLNLNYNQISDISALAGMTNLTNLELTGNQISDISTVAGLTNLTELRLSRNQINDISVLTGLTNLTGLDLYDNQVSDISALSGLTNIKNLYLPNNQISDISVLAGLTNLEWLSLHDNHISDISALAGLTDLVRLWLHNNPLNQDAYDIYIPQIRENNPNINISL